MKIIEDKYYNICSEQLDGYGYYKEELYELIDAEFICKEFGASKRMWLTLLDGKEMNDLSMRYKIEDELKNKIVSYIIDNIEKRICTNYGKLTKEIIMLDSCSDTISKIYPNYNQVVFKKPFIDNKIK